MGEEGGNEDGLEPVITICREAEPLRKYSEKMTFNKSKKFITLNNHVVARARDGDWICRDSRKIVGDLEGARLGGS